jgi:integrase
VPRGPKGKRVATGDGYSVAGKNTNGVGSVYFEPPSTRADGAVVKGRWRATYVDLDGKVKRVSGPTRALAESRRDELVAALDRRRSPTTSKFSVTTTVRELSDWWLESVARHQVRASSLATYRKSVAYLVDELGPVRVIDVGPEVLTAWQSALLDRLAPYTVLSCRKACRQIFAEAVKMGLIATNPFDLVHAPRAAGVKEGRALSAADARKLVTAAASIRLGAAVTLLFCQGWRVSEVLGLAWEDLDLEAGTARIRRAATHSTGSGVTFGPTKTSGAQGLHHLAPIAVAQLRAHRAQQSAERLALGSAWPEHTYQGKPISPVFTNTMGALVNRQAVTKIIQRTAQRAGLDPAGLATHTGRRTVITALYAEGGLDLTDVARHVGHSSQATTAGYVKSLGQRPAATARRAAQLLDPTMIAE